MKFVGFGRELRILERHRSIRDIRHSLAKRCGADEDEVFLAYDGVILEDFHRTDFYNIPFGQPIWFGRLEELLMDSNIVIEFRSNGARIIERIVARKGGLVRDIVRRLARIHEWVVRIELHNHRMERIFQQQFLGQAGLLEFPFVWIITGIPKPFVEGHRIKFRGFGVELVSYHESMDLVKEDLAKASHVAKGEITIIYNSMILESDQWIRYYRVPTPPVEDILWFGRLSDYIKSNEFVLEIKSPEKSDLQFTDIRSMYAIPLKEKIIVQVDDLIGHIRNRLGKIYKWIGKIPFWNYKKDRLYDDRTLLECELLDHPTIFMSTPSIVPCSNEGPSGSETENNATDPKLFLKSLGQHIVKSSSQTALRSFLLSKLQSLPQDAPNREQIKAALEKVTPMSFNVALSSISNDQPPMMVVGTEKITVGHCKQALANRRNRRAEEFIIIKDNCCLKDEDVISNYEYSPDSYVALRSGISYFALSKLDNIKMEESVGEGGFGKVYKCEDLVTNKMMAIKEIEIPENTPLSEATGALKEIIAFSKLECHQRIIQYYDFFQKDENTFCITMEYMAHGSLSSYLEINGPLKECEISRICTQVLEGLAYLHDKQIIHRDIKGANILLDEDNNAKLADFGLSKCSEDRTIGEFYEGILQSNVGTLNWTAPEVLLDEPYGLKADIWSFGATVIQMVVGVPPYYDYESVQLRFQVITTKKLDFTPPSTISSELQDFIDCCVKEEPQQRLTARQLLLHRFLQTNHSERDTR